MEAATNLTAVISPLPDEVSNSTWYDLDASLSHVDDGNIQNFTWTLVLHNTSHYLYGRHDSYMFTELGLYRITLVVVDNESNSASDFTAVYAVEDVDKDKLPDWWEVYHFQSRNLALQGGSDDYDNDGYTNFEEYAMGTDPTVPNPQPSFAQYLADNWYYVAIVAAVIVAAVLMIMPRLKKKRKIEEKKKIEAAIEIERALESEK